VKKLLLISLYLLTSLYANQQSIEEYKKNTIPSIKNQIIISPVPIFPEGSSKVYQPLLLLKNQHKTNQTQKLQQLMIATKRKIDQHDYKNLVSDYFYEIALTYLNSEDKKNTLLFLQESINLLTKHQADSSKLLILKLYLDMLDVDKYFEDHNLLAIHIDNMISFIDNTGWKKDSVKLLIPYAHVAENLFKRRKFTKALDIYQAILNIHYKLYLIQKTDLQSLKKLPKDIQGALGLIYLDIAKVKYGLGIKEIPEFQTALTLISSYKPKNDALMWSFYMEYGKYMSTKDMEKSIELYTKASKCEQAVPGQDIVALREIARVKFEHGRHQEAIEELRELTKKSSPSSITIDIYFMLADLYLQAENFQESLKIMDDAYQLISNEFKTTDHSANYWQNDAYSKLIHRYKAAMQNRCYILYNIGALKEAGECFIKVGKFYSETHQTPDQSYLLNVGVYGVALFYQELAKAKSKNIPLEDNKHLQKIYNMARSHLDRALAQSSGDTSTTMNAYTTLSALHSFSQAEMSLAIDNSNKALKIIKKIGVDSLKPTDVSRVYKTRAHIENYLKNYPMAQTYIQDALNHALQARQFSLSQIPHTLKRKILEDTNNLIRDYMDYGYKYQKSVENPYKINQELYYYWINYKGELRDKESRLWALRAKAPKSIQKKIDHWLQLRREYGHLFVKTIYQLDNNNKNSEAFQSAITSLRHSKQKEIEMLEVDINNALYKTKKPKVVTKQISSKLDKGDLFIDFVKAKDFYYVFTIDHNNKVGFNRLHLNTEDLEMKLANFRNLISASEDATQGIQPLLDSGRLLYEILLKDNIDNLKKYSKLIVSPDGDLSLIPFDALYTENNRYLIQEKELFYTASVKDFVKLYDTKSISNRSEKVVLLTGLDYEKASYANKNSHISKMVESKQKKELTELFDIAQPFHESVVKQEIDVFDKVYKNNLILKTEEKGTKSFLERLLPPKILHLSTHSFLGIDNEHGVDPLLQSAIALSGYNKFKENSREGIMTAYEFALLNLYNTELVFLSSCQSGVGKDYSSEGVYGLNQAALLAGAKRVIYSLWSIDAKETANMTEIFYDNLGNTLNFSQALRKSKLDLIKAKKTPYYWAPLVLNGL
jgi:CHAT domain-containing protein